MYLAQALPLLSVEALKASLSGRAYPQPISPLPLSSWMLCGQQDSQDPVSPSAPRIKALTLWGRAAGTVTLGGLEMPIADGTGKTQNIYPCLRHTQ